MPSTFLNITATFAFRRSGKIERSCSRAIIEKIKRLPICKNFFKTATLKFMRCDSLWTADINKALDFLPVQMAFFLWHERLVSSGVELNGLLSGFIIMMRNRNGQDFKCNPHRPRRPTGCGTKSYRRKTGGTGHPPVVCE
jgi:hypothetical protein